ncbi:bifunctional 3-(3-hydroxy-phenyl)propionate/3-hydroxycinnamic acid hydroxylase [Nakamurella sp.]|uniref:bifunctional 3-(3-hydroxy-phenyl)propionate/3-hydroxycinnamic acid hydroxylase n=1 Tax=Nakamurella sp. TaxID=1869182 RepID=UPI003B3A6CAA
MTNTPPADDAPAGPGPDLDADVLIVGAGPAGLGLANLLGRQGVRVIVLEQLPELIDFPRGVGLDDESLRSLQTMGLVEQVLPHTTPQHVMRLVNGKGRVIAEIKPGTKEFGWSRRNAFVQPLVDKVLAQGLDRFDHVDLRFEHTVETIADHGDHVELGVSTPRGPQTLRAAYLVGADGGKSRTRKHIGVSFEGQSPSTRWLVIDVNDDPLGTPNVFLGADPRRPYVSLGLPHAIRRFEFMLFDDEPDSLVDDPTFVEDLLKDHVPHPASLNFIRQRVYTHHSRIAGSFRQGRIFLAGDAAHLMPVWQGQGYNSGMRDSTNLAWKLAAVLRGDCDDALLDTYDVERRDHAKAMIDISVAFGRVIKPTNRVVAGVRDAAAAVLNAAPPVKRYFAEMRYKPMPRYHRGAVVDATTLQAGRSAATLTGTSQPVASANTKVSPVGTQFIQPRVDTADRSDVLLDDLIGATWAVLCWGTNPAQIFSADDLITLKALGATLISLRPVTQLHNDPPSDIPGDGTIVAADRTGEIKRWFDDRPTPVVFLRPDRFVAAAGLTQDAPALLASLLTAISFRAA